MERKRRSEEIHLAGLYARNLGANLIGVMTVEVLNIFSPLEVFGLEKAPIFADRGWLLILVLYPVIFLVAGLLQYLVQRPISKLISQSRARQKNRWGTAGKGQTETLESPVYSWTGHSGGMDLYTRSLGNPF